MTHRERISAVFRGETVDVIPWVPRIDLWHNAHGPDRHPCRKTTRACRWKKFTAPWAGPCTK